ncbi:hypothetical protein D9M69_494190 [compost metagenome]
MAMEITRRRLASTISFFARRALASPMDMRRLTSLISLTVSSTSCSRSTSFCWLRLMSSTSLPMASAYLALPLARPSDQARSTSLPGNRRRKSARGMRASRTQSCMMARSWARTRSRALRTFSTRASNCFGTSLIGMKSSARASSSSTACLLSRPCFLSAFLAFSSCSDTAVKRRRASSGSGPPSPSSSVSSPSASSSSSSSFSLAAALSSFRPTGSTSSAGRVPSSGSM